jgi:hypothetical protein
MMAMNKGRLVARLTLGMLLSLLEAPYFPTALGQEIPPAISIFSSNGNEINSPYLLLGIMQNGSYVQFRQPLIVYAMVGYTHGHSVYICEISVQHSWVTNDKLIYQNKYSPYNLPDAAHWNDTQFSWSGYLNITNIPAGPQSIFVTVVEGGFDIGLGANGSQAVSPFTVTSTAAVNFIVDNPPTISWFEPQNSSYSGQNSVPLHFTIDKTASWIGYRLDNNAVFTLPGNITLLGLADGAHSLVVYANDSYGSMGQSDTFFFNIALSTPTPSLTIEPTVEPVLEHTLTPAPIIIVDPIPLPLLQILFAIIVLTVSAAIMIVYFRRRKL